MMGVFVVEPPRHEGGDVQVSFVTGSFGWGLGYKFKSLALATEAVNVLNRLAYRDSGGKDGAAR